MSENVDVLAEIDEVVQFHPEHPHFSLAMFILVLGGFITIFDIFVVNISITSIQE